MRLKIALMMLMVLLLIAYATADSSKGPLAKMGFQRLPGSRFITEINLPAGKLLDDLVKDMAPWLGFKEMTELNVVVYGLDPSKSAQSIYGFYEPTINSQEWNTMVRSFEDGGMAVLYNVDKGMLIMTINPSGKPDREMTFTRIVGKIDPSTLANPDQKLPSLVEKMVASAVVSAENGSNMKAASKIPIGQPISVPPSERLHLKATRSDITARVLNQNTAEIRFASRVDDPGELTRVDERLVLELTPKVQIDEMVLPGTIPLLLELTDGSLTLSGGPGPNDKPERLRVIATSAPVSIKSIPLTSGSYAVKSIKGYVQISLTEVTGGSLEVEVTGGDLTLTIPRETSAKVNISAISGKIQNFVTADQPNGDQLSFQMGDGKAAISLKAVNGTVCIKTSE